MSSIRESREHFDRLYARAADPWGLADSYYESRKRELFFTALPRPRFRSCFEPGCALGLNTLALADRCDHVLATDISPAAVIATSARLAGRRNVSVRLATLPGELPTETFELVLLSEVGYYIQDLAALREGVRQLLAPDGVLAACHWRHPGSDTYASADEVHDEVGRDLNRVVSHVETDFLLDVWSVEPCSYPLSGGLIP